MKKYFNHQIKKNIIVQSLVTIESLDISTEFSYPEEIHNFYEFAYIDSGSLLCHIGDITMELKQGDFFLIPPQKKHFYEAKKTHSASIFIVCFCCGSDILTILDKKIPLNQETKLIISDIVKESKNTFQFPFDKKLKLLETPVFGAQQLVESNIEKLLIHLIRNEMCDNENVQFVMNSVELENNLVNDLITILRSNIYKRITLDEIRQQTFYSKTFLNNVFKKNTGYSIMQYYNILKIQEAKKLLRENMAPSVISQRLNFESPTYFTKVFKKHTGMTPTAYRKTVL